MTDWLRPLHDALDAADAPVRFFFRDDDAGWDDAALAALLAVFERSGLPLDLAAIPAATSASTVALLRDRIDSGRTDVAVHQHGYAHVNHEATGRKCEFGPSRSVDQQRDDIARGRDLLAALLPETVSVFTPPWNRCAPWTATVLRDLDVAVLSRDVSAGLAQVPGLAELPISVDWFGKLARMPVDRQGRGELLAGACRSDQVVGVMLHHAVMSAQDLADLAELLDAVAAHPRVSVEHLHRLAAASHVSPPA